MKYVTVNLSDLAPDPDNPRIHDRRNIDLIKKNLQKHGQYRPFIIRKTGNIVIIGNGMRTAMLELGMETGFAIIRPLTEEQARVLSILDNRAGDTSEFARGTLRDKILALPPELREATGFTDEEIAELQNFIAEDTPESSYQHREPAQEGDAVKFVFGRYSFYIVRTRYQEWVQELKDMAGGSEEAIKASLFQQIGLEDV